MNNLELENKRLRQIHEFELGKIKYWFNLSIIGAVFSVIVFGVGGLIYAWMPFLSIGLFVTGFFSMGGCYFANYRRNCWDEQVSLRLNKQWNALLVELQHSK